MSTAFYYIVTIHDVHMQIKNTYKIAFLIILAYSSLKIVRFAQEQNPLFSMDLLIPVMLILTTLWLYGKAFGKVLISDRLLSVLLGVFGAAYLIHDIANLV
jgi:hypothetical protein